MLAPGAQLPFDLSLDRQPPEMVAQHLRSLAGGGLQLASA